MLSTIAKPFGILLMWLYKAFGNYGVAVIFFGLIVKLILLPFMAKSKKSMMRTSRIQPMMKELEKRHGANKQKYNEELQKLYREEKINPMSGCLWSIIPFPIVIALYQVIRFPITVMMGVDSSLIAEGGALYNLIYNTLGFTPTANSAYIQLEQAQFITNNWAQHKDQFLAISDKLTNINYSFLGMDLGMQPNWKFFMEVDWSQVSSWLPQLGLFLIPIIAAALTYVSYKASMASQPAPDPDQPNQQSMMMFSMPIMTLFFAFMMPAALGIYWIVNSLFAAIQDFALTAVFKKQMAVEDAERLERQKIRDAELEAKRLETERLRAENNTNLNPNTSKKKQQIKERQQQGERAAEWDRQQQKAKSGTRRRHRQHSAEDAGNDPSRVGNRPYARGRGYDPERFSDGRSYDEQPSAEDDTLLTFPNNDSQETTAEDTDYTPETSDYAQSSDVSDNESDDGDFYETETDDSYDGETDDEYESGDNDENE